MKKSDFLPCLPLRDIVIFPGMIVPLFVGRDKSIKSLNEVMKTNKKIILLTQKMQKLMIPQKKIFILMDVNVKYYNFLNCQMAL